MRSLAFLSKSRLVLKANGSHLYIRCSFTRPSRILRRDHKSVVNRVSFKRKASTASSDEGGNAANTTPDPTATPPDDDPDTVISIDDPEKRKRRPKSTVSTAKDSDSLLLPSELNIVWTPGPSPSSDDTSSESSKESASLPPPEIFEEALHNLSIALHPHTQHRASYPSPTGPPIEPTLALYCPIEGGDYIIDETVRELARQTSSEVIVLDAVQLAAGQCGHFGKAANCLQFERNPLHFVSPTSPPSSGTRSQALDDDYEEDMPSYMPTPSQMTLTVLSPLLTSSSSMGRTLIGSSSKRTPEPSKLQIFFDELVNISGKSSSSSDSSNTPSGLAVNQPCNSRIIYIRDFPTLAPSSSSWYPPLLSAVRQRRKGPIARLGSATTSPITIVFGITPPLVEPASSEPPNSPGLLSMLMSRSASPSPPPLTPKSVKPEWAEDELSEKGREKRLKNRLKRWEKGDKTLMDELPSLASHNEADGRGGPRSGIVIIGGPAPSSAPPIISAKLPGGSAELDEGGHSRFFRSSVLVPRVRSPSRERATRISRRREINELTIRMAAGAIGGVLGELDYTPEKASQEDSESDKELNRSLEDRNRDSVWDDWGHKVEVWTNVKRFADRALGSVVAKRTVSNKPTLEPTIIPWSAVYHAWASEKSSHNLRKTWMTESFWKGVNEEPGLEENDSPARNVDEVVERIKQDPELDLHQQRLLSCIVDTASMPTSFSQVHLPSHTIDSVRTMVSLPLLYPTAFKEGILKEHGMTGCLLFGPPGTGKTLLARALAREAGCRMMAISPSDVLDMYVGEGEKLVKAVFSLARKLSPCVIFLDEIDALFGARMSSRESGGAFAHRGVITEFMQEMDGLKTSREDNVILIGATNRPFDLDDAVLRRLPRRLLVDLPGEKEREEILKILLRDENLAFDLDLKALATKTESFSGSDLKRALHFAYFWLQDHAHLNFADLCVSAALHAVKDRVDLPWNTGKSLRDASPVSTASSSPETPLATQSANDGDDISPEARSKTRVLSQAHFSKALHEITPSSSEFLGSLASLRKWNEEFGEGRKDRKRKQVWGIGRFGFTNKDTRVDKEGMVTAVTASCFGSDPER